MKRILMLASTAAALALGLGATSASAQSTTTTGATSTSPCAGNACTPTPTPTPTSPCAGNACTPTPMPSGIMITVDTRVGTLGDFRAMFDAGPNGTGEAMAIKEGGAYSTFDITFDNCSNDDCLNGGRVTANVGGYEIGQSMAMANSPTPGQWAVAQNQNLALGAGQLIVTRGPAPAAPTGH